MDIISLYEDWARDAVNKDENGPASYEMFNRVIIRASNRLLNFLTGGTTGMDLPFTYSTEKAKGFISFLITPYKQQVIDGVMEKPADYYSYENLEAMSLKDDGCEPDKDCDDESNGVNKIIYTPIELLDGQQFTERSRTNIELLKPENKPIAKEVGKNFEFLPLDIANVKLEYVRYPIAGEIKWVPDTQFNDLIADPATSIDTEWPEWARELLLFFMTDSFANKTSQASLKQNNIVTAQIPGK